VAEKIDVTDEIRKLEARLRDTPVPDEWRRVLGIVARWQEDSMLTDRSRQMAATLVQECRRKLLFA